MEFIFKFILSVVMVGVCAFGLRWIWTSHLDVRATVDRAVTKFSEHVTLPPEWVVTREPDKIYQQGKNTGDVLGTVEHKDGKVIFSQIVNAGELMFDKPFEYQRLTLRVLHIDRYIGMQAGIGKTLTGVLEGVTCEVIQ